jgi:hypothetical protein
MASCILTIVLTGSAFGSHKTGDFALPDLITPGDYNQDGNLDLAVNLSGFDNIAILDGDGQGNFTLKEHVETDTLPKGLTAGYVDKDGYLDLVSICKWGYTIRIYLGDGIGGFVPANELKGDGEPTRISLNDVNNDGKLDLIANAPDEGEMLIYLGLGSGGFSNPPLEVDDLGNDDSFAVGDLNNDGKIDIAVLQLINTAKTSNVIILLGDGAGGFTNSSQFDAGATAAAISVTDLNHDGNLDLLVAGAGPEDESGLFLSSYLGDGTGKFAANQTLELGTGALEGVLGLGDFNEDGNIDVAYPITFSQNMTRSTTVLTFLGDGTGNLTQGQPVTVGAGPHSALAADFNGDGHLDLAVTNRTDGTLSIMLGDGHGAFTTKATLTVADLPQL